MSVSGRTLSTLFPNLCATGTARLPFRSDILLRSFLLKRAQGNIIVYNSPGISECSKEIQDLGKPSYLLINHEHEVMFGNPPMKIPTWIHEDDVERLPQSFNISNTFKGGLKIDDDVEIIHTPGHTAGASSFLWQDDQHKYLFSGDSIWIEKGEWKAVVLDNSLRQMYIDSLKMIKDLDFDVLIPWGVAEGDQPYSIVKSTSERHNRIDQIIRRISHGENF